MFIADREGKVHIYDTIGVPPKKVQTISTESKGAMRGLLYDRYNNNIFTCCYDDGRVHGYNLGDNAQNDIEIEKIVTINSAKGCRELAYVGVTNQLVVGYENGMVSVFNLDDPKCPFYSRRVHTKDLTKISYLPSRNLLMTGSKDRTVKFWSIRHGKEIEIEEQQEEKRVKKASFNPFEDIDDDEEEAPQYNNTNTVEHRESTPQQPFQKQPIAQDDESDSDDDLMGWND